ncbi:hypothetical protein CDD83_7612 [Cordyceps sp. RAO-2017]|nr:hypothetical protein CDD83_7612 [Cordyceps sp. RAO-2017]
MPAAAPRITRGWERWLHLAGALHVVFARGRLTPSATRAGPDGGREGGGGGGQRGPEGGKDGGRQENRREREREREDREEDKSGQSMAPSAMFHAPATAAPNPARSRPPDGRWWWRRLHPSSPPPPSSSSSFVVAVGGRERCLPVWAVPRRGRGIPPCAGLCRGAPCLTMGEGRPFRPTGQNASRSRPTSRGQAWASERARALGMWDRGLSTSPQRK